MGGRLDAILRKSKGRRRFSAIVRRSAKYRIVGKVTPFIAFCLRTKQEHGTKGATKP
jgi:hypothetical protein